ncbi:tRNA (adenosine(37)-N6)-dimethylallyltransferase MiaA [Sphingosinicella terrae]|uniref:tRNA (adenosine(37)-N6)-dimethylallyltransferase MiaA n=1 Tax=Sphingosinicella terrae TaxID=2172047 RepID=UPI000E0D7B28|nr:tRNA (adenosine(37)-N6)-dimethylallyltransferase MiaA [Sphingosinicella terrae]
MNKTSSSKPPLALIAGPTASGKSALALRLAETRNGVVVNADSAQVYRDLRIVTARPTAEDESRAPHRLYGYRDGAAPCSAAAWAADARTAIAEVHGEGRLPILAGGTGLYLRTLLDGIAPVPDIDPAVRAQVRALPVAEAHAALACEDPAAAARIRPADSARTARALEVVRSTGRPLADWQQAHTGGIGDRVALAPLILLPPRDWLHARCDERFEGMMSEQGLEEVCSLLMRDISENSPVLRAIGVPEIAAFLRGETDRQATVEAGRTATRRYAKRQYTWFRHQPPSDWPRFTDPLDALGLDRALDSLASRVGTIAAAPRFP